MLLWLKVAGGENKSCDLDDEKVNEMCFRMSCEQESLTSLCESCLYKSNLNIQEGQKIQEMKPESNFFMLHSSFMCSYVAHAFGDVNRGSFVTEL